MVVTNRIQHVCAPYGRPARLSTADRVLLRLPAIVMLSYSLYGMLQVLCADTHTPSAQVWLAYVRPWVPAPSAALDPRAQLWSAFLSTCVSQCASTVIRSLELTYVMYLTQLVLG